jgi:hypothetical protein
MEQRDGGALSAEEAAAAALAAMDPFPDMSEEEVAALLEAYEKSGAALGPVPEDLKAGGQGRAGGRAGGGSKRWRAAAARGAAVRGRAARRGAQAWFRVETLLRAALAPPLI